MSIYIVRNENHEEVSAYTDRQRANYMVDELQSATFRSFSVEEMVIEDGAQRSES